MGFSSSLQGSNEALLSRQDAEIRLVENIRRCMAIRIKADREYAIHLNAFLLQAGPLLKSCEKGLFPGSLVLGAWRALVLETEKLVRHIKENADYLATSTIEKVNLLYNEKKQNRKYHAEEHSRIHSELSRLSDSVEKNELDYERVLEAYQLSKVKYNDCLASSKGKVSSKRAEETKEKYHKASKRLQSTHNDYVLLLSEASEFERDMRTILLPGLLEHQQALQEGFVEKLKIILTDLHRFTNNANKKCSEMQYRIEKSVGSIKSGEEYVPFIESHKSSPPSALHFRFDESLSANIQGIPGLSPSGIILNEHTLEPLKSRLKENEARLGEIRVDLKDRQTQIIQLEAEMSVLVSKTDYLSRNKVFGIKKKVDGLKKEIQECLCVEQKFSRQNELIVQSSVSENSDSASLDLGNLSKGSSVSVNNIVTPLNSGLASNIINNNNNNVLLLNEAGSSSSGSGDSKKILLNTLLKSLTLKKNPSSLSMMDREPELDEDPLSPGGSVTDSLVHHHHLHQNGQGSIGSNSSSLMTHIVGRPLEEELWFHGVLPRGEVVRLLQVDGDFLVRETIRNDEKQIVLSVMWSTPKHFIVQTSPEGMFRFEGPPYGTVQELIIHQYYSGTSVTSRSGAILKNPVLREDWELNNDDVELLEKIGRGNFGDVYRARLSRFSGTSPVAVKTCKITLPEEQKKKFLGEGRILKQYDHPNIVKFIGICVQKQPIMIVMELVPGGSLLNFLREKGTSLNTKSLIGMCLDAAAGMKYLESKNCIHRDLAARNCLVGENNSVKISDFGMSREEEEYTVSDGLKQIPIKWTAPEALNYGKYTSLCDVWSFGVLCWEVFSRGGTPYQGMTNTKAREKLDSGYRMPSPENTPEEIYKLMLTCWHYNPEERHHFDEIHATIDLLYSRTFEPLGLLRSFSRTSLTNRIFSEYGTISYNKWLRTLLKRFNITSSDDASSNNE